MAQSFDKNGPADAESADTDAWPETFPHATLDRLLDQLEEGETVDPGEAQRVLGLVAREAERLRATVARLSVEKLSEADREARAIVEQAFRHADGMRAVGLASLDSRLDEVDRLSAGMRKALQVELRAAGMADRPSSSEEPR